ncbi:outer membrane beta-barrel protein [Chitinophaga sp. CF418]|uniref:outer membrane beta-barrel protein n=1 Tax=Chitinophaga sp. CF418 TaxID=1855287 RepID=UPI00091DD893|nr:outer membrane beta-barrel protein [Chitinophaga sp. CF418]SHM42008.1 Outer membrane protein beta-barrel domain-containing protein [Chitinophaga sp. CF418]
MSKFFTLFILTLLTSLLPLHAQVSLGLRGGYTLSATQIKNSQGYKSNSLGTNSQLTSLHADLIINVPVYKRLYFQPLVRYITKGAYLRPLPSKQGIFVESANQLKLHYLEVPLNMVLKFPVSLGKIVVGAGPYVAYGLNGTYDLDLMYNGSVVSTDSHSIEFNYKDRGIAPGAQLRRFDAGADLMFGIEFNNLMVFGANLSRGMFNLDRTSSAKITNSYFSMSLGILLNREDY